MANGIVASPGRPSSHHAGATRTLRWIPIALGGAAIVAGIGGRRKGAAALAFTAVAGAAAMRNGQLERWIAAGTGRGASAGEHQLERSITIGKTPDELRLCWLDPRTLPKLMADFATVRTSGDGRMHWDVKGPLGHSFAWDTETVDRGGDGIGWRSMADSTIPNEGMIRFRPAPADRGTVATLRIRFDPPGDGLGDQLVKLLGSTPLNLVADGALRRFKNLVETSEIPTTARQPAARADTH